MVLRRENKTFVFVGEAVVDGFMYSQGVDKLADGKYELRKFETH